MTNLFNSYSSLSTITDTTVFPVVDSSTGQNGKITGLNIKNFVSGVGATGPIGIRGATGPQGIPGPIIPATTTTLGAIIAGHNLAITTSGVLSSVLAVVGDTPPANPLPGDQWWDSEQGRGYVFYNGQWVEMSPNVSSGGIIGTTIMTLYMTPTPPTTVYPGALWYDTTGGRTYILYDDFWVDASPSLNYILPTATTSTLGGVKVDGTSITIDGNGVISASGSAAVDWSAVPSSIVPTDDLTYDLGSIDKQWRSLYVGTATIFIGGVPLTLNTASNTLVIGTSTNNTSTTALATEQFVIEYITTATGGAVVERTVSFPLGQSGDTRGTIALTPEGETYVCTADWENSATGLQGTFTTVTVELYDIAQSGGIYNSAVLSIEFSPEIYNIIRYGSWTEGQFTIDAGVTWGGAKNVTSTSYNDQAGIMSVSWAVDPGDPQEIPLGTSIIVVYSGNGTQLPIWKRLVDLTTDDGDYGAISWRNPGDLTIETLRPQGYTGDCDLNLYAADDVWITANGDEVSIQANTNVVIESSGGNHAWTFAQNGSLQLPNLNNTGYNWNYSLNGPTLRLGGENDPNDQVIITGPQPDSNNANAQRLVIQGQRGYGTWGQNIAGEGGDVYIWGGVGGESDNGGGGSGGDIKIRGGQGQNNDGGYVKIEGGSAAGWNNSPTGGYVEIRGGNAVENGNGDGGDVRIFGGKKHGTGNNGVVYVSTGANEEFQWQFDNGGVLHLPTGGDIVNSNGTSVLGGAQLVGDGYASGQGTKRVVYTNYAGYQGGEPTSLVVKDSDVVGISVGDSITFRNGEVRLITGISPWNDPNTQIITWTDSVNGGEMNPRYPVTLTTANYTEETKLTARIKPDLSTEGSGQYMDVYVGGAAVLDNKHVHMKGHDADTELFLGSDSNFVSAKDGGASPARVNLKSENDITVSETNLRMTRGSTWAVVYGDGKNRNFHNNTYDLTWNTITSDDRGNFYVGGEAASNAEAMVAKYGPDGDLIWKKMVNGNDTQGWQVDGVAYNPVDQEVAFAVQTNYDKDHSYYKLTVFDSETGVIKTTTDVYDNDGNVNARALTWHPTLGYVLVGDTSGEVATTGNIRTAYESVVTLTTTGVVAPQDEIYVNDIGTVPSVGDYFTYSNGTWTVTGVNTYSGYYGLLTGTNTNFGVDPAGGTPVVLHHNSKSGVGIIELPRESVKINGFYPSLWSNWRINGTNVTDQELQNGVGLYQNVPVINLTNPGSTGLTVGIRIDYSGIYYERITVNSSGTGTWNYDDDFKILGSNLGGVDGGTVGVFNQVINNGGTVYFPQASYPTLNVDVTPGTFARFQNNAEGTVSSVSDAGDGNWAVNVTMSQGQSMALGNVIFYHGNDIVGKIADQNDIQNGFTGTPSLTSNYRIDMGYFMGYGSADFTGGTFSISTPLNSRAYVWTSAWSKIYNPTVGAGYSYGRCVAVDHYDGGLVVGGYDNTVARGFVWKLNSSGDTQWVKGFTNENGYNVTSLAVSKMNGTIYFTTDFDSLNVFTSAGTLLKRIQLNGPFGFNGSRVELEQQLDGEEYLYWGGNFASMWTSNNGFLVSKLNSSLETVWSRSIRNSNSDFYTNYDQALDCVALGRGNIVAVGYSYAMSEDNYNGILASISTTDNFDAQVKDGWYVETPGGFVGYTDSTGDYTVLDLLNAGGSAANGTLANTTGSPDLSWNNWSWKSVVVNLNKIDNGIAGVESIKFADGGKLDHNPSDIPPAVTDFHNEGWNYTLQLSDRGRFIINQKIPNDSYAQDLYITVPSNMNVAFPVGSVITLINANDSNNNGYRIYVQPEYYINNFNQAPRIWAAGTGNQNPSTWSFQGLQTATLMKIGSNEWILTANNIQNED